jgi:hypothetical protein
MRSNAAMPKHAHPLRLPAAACVLALAGCASQADMETQYGHALFAWRSATRAELLAKWGPPQSAAAANGVEELTWVLTEGERDVQSGRTTTTYSRPATLPGGPTAVATPNVGAGTMVATVPVRCMTRFELREGVVKDWSFRGVACGAPGFMPPGR